MHVYGVGTLIVARMSLHSTFVPSRNPESNGRVHVFLNRKFPTHAFCILLADLFQEGP